MGLLMLSQYVDSYVALRLTTEFHTGVGYLLKDRVSDLDTFAADVRRVGRGDCVIDPELVFRLLAKRRQADPLASLTARERSVLELMAHQHPRASAQLDQLAPLGARQPLSCPHRHRPDPSSGANTTR